MSRRFGLLIALLIALALAAYALWPRPAPTPVGFSLQELLGGESVGYARAETVRKFEFPVDHGAHPDYRSEWWYLTGNLYTAEGRRFGFQFTVFRFALAPRPRGGESDWGTRQAYMAHFTLTDLESGRFHAFERFSRGAAGLAGADADPLRIWLEDWRFEGQGKGEPWPARLQVREQGVALDLWLVPRKPPVLQGEQGLSRKGPEPGNASYYYSYSRLQAGGQISLADEALPVTGRAWLDREWSTSALSPDLEGWDWFSLQLADGGDLMVYRLRRRDGGSSPFSGGVYVPAKGPPQHLAAADFGLRVEQSWTSRETGVRYPSRWRLTIPSLQAELTVAAALPEQELDLAVRYWEGAVDVGGSLGGGPAAGVGYMELTGYGGGERVRGD